jgi:hypothetical protein
MSLLRDTPQPASEPPARRGRIENAKRDSPSKDVHADIDHCVVLLPKIPKTGRQQAGHMTHPEEDVHRLFSPRDASNAEPQADVESTVE